MAKNFDNKAHLLIIITDFSQHHVQRVVDRKHFVSRSCLGCAPRHSARPAFISTYIIDVLLKKNQHFASMQMIACYIEK